MSKTDKTAGQIEWLESLDEALGLAEKRAQDTLVVEVPAIRYRFTIKRLTVADIDEAAKRAGKDDMKASRQLFQLSVVPRPSDEQVSKLFDKADVSVISEIMNPIRDFNGMGATQVEREDSFPA